MPPAGATWFEMRQSSSCFARSEEEESGSGSVHAGKEVLMEVGEVVVET